MTVATTCFASRPTTVLLTPGDEGDAGDGAYALTFIFIDCGTDVHRLTVFVVCRFLLAALLARRYIELYHEVW